MRRLLLRMLATVTACSTLLAGMPTVPAAAIVVDSHGGSIAAAPADAEVAIEARAGDPAEEREEESESKAHPLTGRIGGGHPSLHVRRFVAAGCCRGPAAARPSDRSIRGPPIG